MNSIPPSISRKKTIVDIGDVLLEARHLLWVSNAAMQLKTLDCTRIILLLVLLEFIRDKIQIENGSRNDSEDILGITNAAWVNDFLRRDIPFSEINLRGAQECLDKQKITRDFDLFLHAAEVLEYNDLDISDSKRDRRNGIVTNKKKSVGIYYTPVDVTNHMVSHCIAEMKETYADLLQMKYVDFSCGSGIFIIEILEQLYILRKEKTKAINLLRPIHGVDISETAISITQIGILIWFIQKYGYRINYEELWSLLKNNIVCADSTTTELYEKYPFFPQEFNCIIGNPPYVSKNRGNLFIPFVEMLTVRSSANAVGALIVPLSITYSTFASFKTLRRLIENSKAKWVFENFDRSPDALFGDDVKSRNSIIFFNNPY